VTKTVSDAAYITGHTVSNLPTYAEIKTRKIIITSLVLHRGETWCIILGQERITRVL